MGVQSESRTVHTAAEGRKARARPRAMRARRAGEPVKFEKEFCFCFVFCFLILRSSGEVCA